MDGRQGNIFVSTRVVVTVRLMRYRIFPSLRIGGYNNLTAMDET